MRSPDDRVCTDIVKIDCEIVGFPEDIKPNKVTAMNLVLFVSIFAVLAFGVLAGAPKKPAVVRATTKSKQSDSAEKEVGKAVVNLFNEKIGSKFKEAAKEVEGILNKQLGSHMKQAKAKMLMKEITAKISGKKAMKAGPDAKCGLDCKAKKIDKLAKAKPVHPSILKATYKGAKNHSPEHNKANRLRKNNGAPMNPLVQGPPGDPANANVNPFHSQPWGSQDQSTPPQTPGAPPPPGGPPAPGAPPTGCPPPCGEACFPKCSQDCCRPMMPLQNFPQPPPPMMPPPPPPPPFVPPQPPPVPSCPVSCYNHCYARCPNGCCGVLKKKKRKSIPKIFGISSIISTNKVDDTGSNVVERNMISSMQHGNEKVV